MSWYPCGCCRYCPLCANGKGPARWQIDVLASVPAGFEGTYVLDGTGDCTWELALDPPINGAVKVSLTMSHGGLTPPGGNVTNFYFEFWDSSSHRVWGTSWYIPDDPMSWYSNTPPDCMNITNLDAGFGTALLTALRPCDAA